MSRRIVPGEPPLTSAKKIDPGKIEEPILWNFSFRFLNNEQMSEYFGLDAIDSSWFVSFMERLRDLCRQKKDSFIAGSELCEAYRYHPINWNQKNIPIRRDQMKWIDEKFLVNDEEYPMLQFQISTALGRIVGFWDEKQIFNIVLIDRYHNLQPSSRYNYQITRTRKGDNVISKVMNVVKGAIQGCTKKSCSLQDSYEDIHSRAMASTEKASAIVHINDDEYDEIEKLISEGHAHSVEDILSYGITAMRDALQAAPSNVK